MIALREDEIAQESVGEVPLIGLKLMAHSVDEAGRAIEIYRRLRPDQHAQQGIKADEVVDMAMRHENMRDTQNSTRRQRLEIAEIELDGPLFEHWSDEKP